MSLRLNETAPDFQAETTQGTIHFHEWLGNSWGILFLTQKISRLYAQPNWDIWQNSNPNLQNEIARSSV